MPDTINPLRALEITAHHEAGHAVVATLLGKPISYLKLFHSIAEGIWNGSTPTDPSTDVMAQWTIPNLNGSMLPNDAQLHPYTDDEYKNTRDTCTIKCAGLVVEKRMGIDVSLIKPGGSEMDIHHTSRMLA